MNKAYKFLMMTSNPNLTLDELEEFETLCREKLRIIKEKKQRLSIAT